MATRGTKVPEQKCPVCKTWLGDRREYEHAMSELEGKILRKQTEVSNSLTKHNEKAVAELKKRHTRELQIIKSNYRKEQEQAYRELAVESKKEKERYRKKIEVMKKNYRVQLQNIREVYDKQNLTFQKDQEYAFNNQLKEIIQNYGNLASGHQKELERVKKIQDDTNSALRKKDTEIAKLKVELARSTSELQVKELVLQINERNVMIERLQTRIRDLESHLGIQSPPPTNVKEEAESQSQLDEDEQKQKLKEYMRAIIEITRNQQMAEKKRRETNDARNETLKDEQGSKADKVLGWFL